MEKSLIGRLAFWQKRTEPTSLGVYVCADKLWVYAPAQKKMLSSGYPLS